MTETREVITSYGAPSAPVTLGTIDGVPVAFIPRHGPEHTILPHKVPYKANLAALQQLGVRYVFATCVVGSLKKDVLPGWFVVPDQFINFTWGRDDTSAVDSQVIHLPMAHPYCVNLRMVIVRELHKLRFAHADRGTVVVIQGPRFSTIAESRMFAQLGGDIVNMTQYPECYFARSLGMCYAAVASVTDYDVGVPSDLAMEATSMEKVLAIFHANTGKTHQLLSNLVSAAYQNMACDCARRRIDEYYKS